MISAWNMLQRSSITMYLKKFRNTSYGLNLSVMAKPPKSCRLYRNRTGATSRRSAVVLDTLQKSCLYLKKFSRRKQIRRNLQTEKTRRVPANPTKARTRATAKVKPKVRAGQGRKRKEALKRKTRTNRKDCHGLRLISLAAAEKVKRKRTRKAAL